MKRYRFDRTGRDPEVRDTGPGFGYLHSGAASRTRPRSPEARVGSDPAAAMYVVELSLKLSPMPIAVQRKELSDAQSLYAMVKQALEGAGPRVLELTCEKDEHKKVSLLSSEVVGVQVYEKSASASGGRRPGFSFDT